jgi:hypothetical protein
MEFFDQERTTMSTKLAGPSPGAFCKLQFLLGPPLGWGTMEDVSGTTVTPRRGPFPGWDGAGVLEPHVTRIVRRALQQEMPASALTRRIHDLASRIEGGDWPRRVDLREPLVRRMTRLICHSLRQRLGPR